MITFRELFQTPTTTYKTHKNAMAQLAKVQAKLGDQNLVVSFIIAVNSEGRFYIICKLNDNNIHLAHFLVDNKCCVTN